MRAQARRRVHRSNALGESAEPLFPKGDLARKGRLARDTLLDRAPLIRAQHAEHVFGGARRPRSSSFLAPDRSSLQTLFQLGEAAPDPALHRAERHARTLRQFLIGKPPMKAARIAND